MLEILLFLVLGTALGLTLGILPGIHPNMIIIFVPLLSALNLDASSLIAFVVSLGVANTLAEFVPSILLAAPDSESGLATLPGQRMIASGKGLLAIRLAVNGGVVAIALCSLVIPLLAFAIPTLYSASRGIIWIVLCIFVASMIITEKHKHKIFWALVCFALSGGIGLTAFELPIDRTLVLFPIFTGLFALPHLLLQIRSNVQMPAQKRSSETPTLRSTVRPAIFGTAGGILSGILPGIGSAEIASVLTIKKDDRSFLATMGALSASNIMISFLALWLIGNPRSGVAVALDQLISVDAQTIGLIIFSLILAAAIAAPLTLWIASTLIDKLQKIDYVLLSKLIAAVLIVAIGIFTGPLGLALAATCCGLGLFVNVINVKRGLLMGVLIVPTVLFFISA